jgi:hypothetical protein
VEVDRANLEERLTSDRETSCQSEPPGKDLEDMEKKGGRRDWKSGKDVERSCSLGPK